jgi:hypothetical protein
MSNKTPAIISAILTIVLLMIFAVLSIFFEMIALNGVSEKQGTIAMGITLLCQGIVTILSGILAGWISNFMVAKFNWNKILVIVIAVTLGTVFGSAMSFFSTIISIPLAGIR